jgi:hypothetical protein
VYGVSRVSFFASHIEMMHSNSNSGTHCFRRVTISICRNVRLFAAGLSPISRVQTGHCAIDSGVTTAIARLGPDAGIVDANFGRGRQVWPTLGHSLRVLLWRHPQVSPNCRRGQGCGLHYCHSGSTQRLDYHEANQLDRYQVSRAG